MVETAPQLGSSTSLFNRRLSDVMELLSSKQPRCPQLYIYSSADRVIPAKSVESFIEGQRRAGHEVRACDFVSSPHVDHYRSNPGLYTSQLSNFLEECVLTNGRKDSCSWLSCCRCKIQNNIFLGSLVLNWMYQGITPVGYTGITDMFLFFPLRGWL